LYDTIFNLQKIGLIYLDYLLDERDFDGAAQLCVKILGKKKELWEAQVLKFHQIHQLKVGWKKSCFLFFRLQLA
jgi:hypothetical protein